MHASAANPVVDVMVESRLWEREAASMDAVQRAIAQAAAMVDEDVTDTELAVVLTDDAAIRTLNHQWRGLDKATNVLSFPAPDPLSDAGMQHLGDIVIAFETLAREAGEEGKPFHHHLSHLAVHGFLHLLGYDHESERDAETMEQLERTILAKLGVPDPYASQDSLEEHRAEEIKV
jgi:probable rRNA maturation factor